MTTVFIAGSMNIKHLDVKVKDRIGNIVSLGFQVLVGDAEGVDTAIQQQLLALGHQHTTVYCSGGAPRNNVGAWPVHVVTTKHAPGTRAFFTAKDLAMAAAADVGLMVWDAKSTGTLSNIIELLAQKKKSVVFVNKEKTFRTISGVEQLDELARCMSEHARRKADEKIGLMCRIAALKHEQSELFA